MAMDWKSRDRNIARSLFGRVQSTVFEDHDAVHALGDRVIVRDDDKTRVQFAIEFEH